MTIQQFASLIAKHEGRKKETSIGNIREILKLINWYTEGELYKMIKKRK